MAASVAKAAFGTQLLIGDGAAGSAKTITAAPNGAARSSNVVTIQTSTTHSMVVGDVVDIAGVTDATFNGRFYIHSIPDTTHLAYRQLGSDTTSGSGTATKVEHVNAIAELKEIPLALKRDMQESSNMDSPNQYREYVVGFADTDAMAVGGNFINTTYQAQLRTDYYAGTKRGFVILWPGTLGFWIFLALVATLDHDTKFGDLLGFTATLKPLGKATLTPGQ